MKKPKNIPNAIAIANRISSCRRLRRAGGEVLGWNLCGEIEYVSLLPRGYPFEYALEWCRALIFGEDEDACKGSIQEDGLAK